MKKSDQYNGAELSDYDGRTGAMQAKYLPSRRGDFLHWQGGTITDMDGRKAKEQERTYTLPVIPTRYELAQAKKSNRKAESQSTKQQSPLRGFFIACASAFAARQSEMT